jgi:hypothetical protein
VRVWREKDGWTGLFKFFTINGETCTIDMPYGPTNFRSTIIKPYYILLEASQEEEEEIENIESPDDDRDESINAEKQPVRMYLMVVIY